VTANAAEGDLPVSLADVEAAAQRIAGRVAATPFMLSRTLSEIVGAELWLKFENLQYTASFKERGACNKLIQLSAEAKRAGVVAMSAGNHAQGVAFHAKRLEIPATIVMPKATPFVKIENTRRLGAEVVLEGHSVEDAAVFAEDLARRNDRTLIHPYDDPEIVAGQGTVALEMLREQPDLDVLVVPIGGGGLIGGIATAAKALAPNIEIIGVEAALYPSVRRLLDGLPEEAGGPTVAEGIAVKKPGDLTMRIIERLVDDVVVVDETLIEAAILHLLEIEKTLVEGAGAVGLAAVEADRKRFSGRRVGLPLSGGNIDSRLLSSVILRGLVRSDRLVRFRVTVPDSPGSLAQFTVIIAERGGNVVDVIHQRAFSHRSVKEADIDCTIETRNRAHADEIADALSAKGFTVRRLGQEAT
jgi:threonine dehydratase